MMMVVHMESGKLSLMRLYLTREVSAQVMKNILGEMTLCHMDNKYKVLARIFVVFWEQHRGQCRGDGVTEGVIGNEFRNVIWNSIIVEHSEVLDFMIKRKIMDDFEM